MGKDNLGRETSEVGCGGGRMAAWGGSPSGIPWGESLEGRSGPEASGGFPWGTGRRPGGEQAPGLGRSWAWGTQGESRLGEIQGLLEGTRPWV